MSFEGPKSEKEKAVAPSETHESLERIPTREAVMTTIVDSLEGIPLTVLREESDKKGLVIFEMQREDEAPGETSTYEYMRKGKHSVIGTDGMAREVFHATNNIEVTHFQDGVPVGGTTHAIYEEETGTWKIV